MRAGTKYRDQAVAFRTTIATHNALNPAGAYGPEIAKQHLLNSLPKLMVPEVRRWASTVGEKTFEECINYLMEWGGEDMYHGSSASSQAQVSVPSALAAATTSVSSTPQEALKAVGWAGGMPIRR